ITSVAWHPRFNYAILAGDSKGDIHIRLLHKSSAVGATILLSFRQVADERTVHCFAFDAGVNVAVGFGNQVDVYKMGTLSEWTKVQSFRNPDKFPELDSEELEPPQARSLHFLGDGAILVATYLEHGIIAWNVASGEVIWRFTPRSCRIYHGTKESSGASVILPRQKMIAATNLYDGIDWYSLEETNASRYIKTTHIDIKDNYPLHISSVQDGDYVLAGGSENACVISTETFRTAQQLEVPGKQGPYLVQAV
ncbi:hypothetical protein FA95DRAFT_1578944, partial [Auriscalpium vulgare]